MKISFNPCKNPIRIGGEPYMVKGTVLNYCMDIPYFKGFGELMTDESRKEFEGYKQCDIDIMILDANFKVLIHEKTTCKKTKEGKMRINFPLKFQSKLQEIFWFSSAVSCCDNDFFKDMDEELQESYKLFVYSSDEIVDGHKINSLCIIPQKVVSRNSGSNKQINMLIEMAHTISQSGLFVLKSKNKSTGTLPDNEVIYASEWKHVSNFSNEAQRVNCIYYLANSKGQVYIGEAISLLNRIEAKKINGEIFLVHKNQSDLDEYGFTMYRIDQITPDASNRMLHSVQDGIIGGVDALADYLKNGFLLTNSAYNKAHNKRRGK